MKPRDAAVAGGSGPSKRLRVVGSEGRSGTPLNGCTQTRIRLGRRSALLRRQRAPPRGGPAPRMALERIIVSMLVFIQFVLLVADKSAVKRRRAQDPSKTLAAVGLPLARMYPMAPCSGCRCVRPALQGWGESREVIHVGSSSSGMRQDV